MIMALLAWYFFGGAATGGAILTSAYVAEIQARVGTTVEDETRSAAAGKIIRDLNKEVKLFEKAFAKSGKRLTRLYKDHADTRQQSLEILGNLNAAWKQGQERALDARFALRNELTKAEWVALFNDR